jgi:hypothetical protein
VALALAAFAVLRIFDGGGVPQVIVLYLGLVIAHDLIFVPFYTGLDRFMRRLLAPLASSRRARIPIINYVRAPLLISALLLLIYSPLILGLSDSYYFGLSGHHVEHYLRNWLLITAALFIGSALVYAGRVAVVARRAG